MAQYGVYQIKKTQRKETNISKSCGFRCLKCGATSFIIGKKKLKRTSDFEQTTFSDPIGENIDYWSLSCERLDLQITTFSTFTRTWNDFPFNYSKIQILLDLLKYFWIVLVKLISLFWNNDVMYSLLPFRIRK